MDRMQTTAAVQHFLDQLNAREGDEPAAPIVRDLLARAADRLRLLCASLLRRSYPRLTRPPLNLQPDEMLSAVIERLLKALRTAHPGNVRQFFALANQHMRWELNDLARHLDEQPTAADVREDSVAAPEVSNTALGANMRRMLEAIEALPEDEREVFSLVHIQGLMQSEVADLLEVSTKTVQRRLNRGLLGLTAALGDLWADQGARSEG